MKTPRTVTITEAKKHLSRLIEEAAQGESFIITKASKPMVQVTAINAPQPRPIRRLGFLAGYASVPSDFDQMAADEISAMFES
jgi:prevent-host-death family protein